MLFTAFGARGLGSVLTQGTDYNCNASICYGIGPARHQLFQRMQTLLNIFSTPVGFAPLVVDGFIGDSTVNAVRLTARAITATGLPGGDLPVLWEATEPTYTKESTAANADDIVLAIAAAAPVMVANRAAAGLPASPVIPPSATHPASASTPPDSVVAPASHAISTATKTKFKKALPWILGGLGAVLLIGGGGYVYYRHSSHTLGWADEEEEY